MMQLQLSSSYQNKDKAVAWTNKIIGKRGLSVSLHNSWLLFFTLSLHVSFGSELTCLVISRRMFLHNSGLICFTLSFIYLLGLRTHMSRWNNLFWLLAGECSYQHFHPGFIIKLHNKFSLSTPDCHLDPDKMMSEFGLTLYIRNIMKLISPA